MDPVIFWSRLQFDYHLLVQNLSLRWFERFAFGSEFTCIIAAPPGQFLPISARARTWTRSPKIGNHLIFGIAIFINHNFRQRRWRLLRGSSLSWRFSLGSQMRTTISFTPGRQLPASRSPSPGHLEHIQRSIFCYIRWQDIRTMYQLLVCQLSVCEKESRYSFMPNRRERPRADHIQRELPTLEPIFGTSQQPWKAIIALP